MINKNGFTFSIARQTSCYKVVQISPKPTHGEEFVKIPNSQFTTLEDFVEDITNY